MRSYELNLSNLTTKEKLKATAKYLFLSKGYHQSSNAEIARISGLVPSAIYKHYRGKEGLLDELIRPHIQTYEKIIEPKTDEFFEWMGHARSTKEICIKLNEQRQLLQFFETLEKDGQFAHFCLTKLQGTKYEFLLKNLANSHSKHAIKLLEFLKQKSFSIPHYTEQQLSIFMEAQLQSYVHILGTQLSTQEKRELYLSVHSYYFIWWASLIDCTIHDYLFEQQYLLFETERSINQTNSLNR